MCLRSCGGATADPSRPRLLRPDLYGSDLPDLPDLSELIERPDLVGRPDHPPVIQ